MKTIISIQHTESIHHTNGMVGGWTDWELSEKGITEAKNIGMNLGNEYDLSKFTIYTSDLKRAHMTALNISKPLGMKPLIEPSLREMNLGRGIGKSSKWYRDNAKPFEHDIDFRCLDDAESTRDHFNRVKPFIDKILSNQEEHIILVSHGGTCGLINTILLGYDVDILNTQRFHTRSGSVSIYQVDKGVTKILKIGDTSYKK